MVRARRTKLMVRTTMLLIICCLVANGLCVNTAVALPGSGMQEDPWRIESLADFDEFAGDANYWDDCTRLETDVNLAGRTYSTGVIGPDTSRPDAFGGTAFTGVFDGKGHKIENLTINDGGAGNKYLGLFGYIRKGQVTNLGLEGGSVSGDALVGGLAGANSGSVSNCYSTSSASGDHDDDNVGGLVGGNQGRIADLDGDGNVSFSDYAIFANDWMKKGSGFAGDLNGDNVVDYNDLEILGENWLCGKKPNGKIAFVSSRDGNYEIYVMDANGSNQERLTCDEHGDGYPAWSPDGKKLAYVSGGGIEISIIDLETGIQTVIFSTNHWLATPTWSPNGGKIAFCYNELGGGIFSINSDGSNQTYLANGWYPDWSPDGEKITYSQGGEIYTMNADGSEQINLTNHPAFDSEASWSPDGMKIAFTSERELAGEIYLMNNDGTEQIRLTYNDWPDRNSSARDASWSPDGNYIAFARGREMGTPEEDITPWLPEIYIINICNEDLTRLTNNDYVNKQPAWRPVENVTELNVLTSYNGTSKTR